MTEDEIKSRWQEFKQWSIQKHHLVPDWQPDFSSILLWEEWKDENACIVSAKPRSRKRD